MIRWTGDAPEMIPRRPKKGLPESMKDTENKTALPGTGPAPAEDPREASVRGRFRKTARPVFFLLLAGALYAVFISVTGLYVPCPFRLVTGLYCPGCGISHYCTAMLRLDFSAAWAANPFLFIVLPLLFLYLLYKAYRYIAKGDRTYKKPETVGLWLLIAAAVVFGVLRNVL